MSTTRRTPAQLSALGLALVAAAAVAAGSLSATPHTAASLMDREVIHGSVTAGTWEGPTSDVLPMAPDSAPLGPEPDDGAVQQPSGGSTPGQPEQVDEPTVRDQPALSDPVSDPAPEPAQPDVDVPAAPDEPTTEAAAPPAE